MSVWENRAALEKKIEKFRKEFENKLRQFDPKNADHYLAVIEENSDGEFYGELVLGDVDLGDPDYGEHPTLARVLRSVRLDRLSKELAESAKQAESQAETSEAKVIESARRDDEIRKLADRIQTEKQEELGGAKPTNKYVHKWLLDHPKDDERVRGHRALKPGQAPGPLTLRKRPTVRVIGDARRKK